METIVYAELKAVRCSATLWLNDIPLLSAGRMGVSMSQLAARQFLTHGENKLELFVEPDPRPSHARGEKRKLTLTDAWATARLVRYEEGVPALVENGKVLLEHHSIPVATEAEYPLHYEDTVVIEDAVHRWKWEQAEALHLDGSLIAEAADVLRVVADTIARGDVDAFMAATAVKIDEANVAYPAGAAGTREELSRFVATWKKASPAFLPLDPDAHDFRVVGGGRLLQPVDVDGFPSLRFRDPADGLAVPYPLLLARIGGRLQVVL